ncbi:MAG TPA: rhamnulokinase family protein [Acidimicrobiales bacterium]|nr:rhamnulokinase family protein [Acidimicrobiales bacterium]
MTGPATYVAVDLGASSGRVLAGRVGDGGLEVEEVHRFPNGGVEILGHLHWDVLAIYRGVLEGVRRVAASGAEIRSIGVDSWGVDYGLLDSGGELIGNPYHHRDRRTDGVAEAVLARRGAAELYRRNGIAQVPFNTVFQLVADRERLAGAESLLLIPDLMGYWLTGRRVAELTNASTTGLLTGAGEPGAAWAWDHDLMGALGIPTGVVPPLISPGETVGPLVGPVAADANVPEGTPLVAVGSHDTASAVAGTPADRDAFAYISSGTWSLLGLELDRSVRTEAAREARFTNEIGVDGTVRFLRNVMGLWLLQECQRAWGVTSSDDLSDLLDVAARLPARRWLIDVDDPALLPPGGMPDRIASACARRGGPVPATPAETVRCIVDSLAVAYRRALDTARQLAGRPVDVIHLVGGGAHNTLLCQLTADACGVPVVAGPVESAAVGNVLVQARADGAVTGDLADLRALVRAGHRLRTYQPGEPDAPWLELAASLGPWPRPGAVPA